MAPVYGGSAGPPAQDVDAEATERFSDRARALFYARLAFLAIGLGVLAVPSWSAVMGATSSTAFAIYFGVIAYSVTNYLVLDHPRLGRPVTFLTLNLDLLALTAMVMASGGLDSPVMSGQLVFTIFFALLFPKPAALIPPMAMLPVVARVDRLAVGAYPPDHVFLLLWYAALSAIALYVLVYLNDRDSRHMRQLRGLIHVREQASVNEERLRLAREMHDGLGGSLSTMIISAEYIQRTTKDPDVKAEVTELKGQAEEAMEELRRSLTMMRRDFDLHKTLEDHCHRLRERTGVACEMKIVGRRRRLPSEMQLTIFRLLQESLTNIQKHANATEVLVTLRYDGDLVSLSVADNGVGFDRGKPKVGHYGLTNMNERVRKFRGTVDVQSAPGAGTTVHATLVVPSEGSHVAAMPVGEG